MNTSSDYPAAMQSPSPRRQLQGPRPTPLKVCNDSYKIKKPPVAPAPTRLPTTRQQSSSDGTTHPPPPPVIIYTVSPKVIHTNPSEFMALVQRLTGPSAVSPSSSIDHSQSSPPHPGVHSPAARLATYERPAQPEKSSLDELDQLLQAVDGGSLGIDRPSLHAPGILSPVPSSLPTISPGFFTHSADLPHNNFQHDQQFSPAFHGSKGNFVDNTFLVSPNYNFLSTSPAMASPGSYWDLFNQYQNL